MVFGSRSLFSRRGLIVTQARGMLAVLSALMLLGLLACSEVELPPAVDVVRPVKFLDVKEVSSSSARVYSGSVEAESRTTISFRVAGTLLKRLVDIGDRVTKGQLLAVLDERDLTIRVREAEAQLTQARAAMRNADANYERTRELYENDNTSKSELDSARAAAESAKAQVRVAQQMLSNSGLQLSYAKVTAPDDCEVSDTFVKASENVNSGQAILDLDCGACADVRVAVPETAIGQISRGDLVSVSVDALPNERFEGVVNEVAVAMASNSSAFPVVVKLRSGCESVRAGMAAEVNFALSSNNSVKHIVIPGVSLGEDRKGRYVYVIERDQDVLWRVRRRAVEIDSDVRGGFRVLSGLRPGERIVTAGVRKINDGMLVKLYQPDE